MIKNKEDLIKKFESLKVIIATENDLNYETDIKMLKQLYIKIANRFSSGLAALDYLKFNFTHLVISDITLSDMSVISFLRRVRREIKNYVVPVIVISPNSEREFVLDVIGAGCSGFIIRPYGLSTLLDYVLYVLEQKKFLEIEEDALEFAKRNISEGKYDEGIETILEIVQDKPVSEAEELFGKGTEFLRSGKYNLAIIAFNKALKINNLLIECYTGLAEAYKGKGDVKKYKYYLQKAADEYARRDRFEEVKELFIKILKTDPNAPNPYNTLGINFRQQGKYRLAIDAYKQALKLNLEDENIHYNMAKALYFSKRYKSALRFLNNALKINPDFSEARLLQKAIIKEIRSKNG